jgi:hypothetical protein
MTDEWTRPCDVCGKGFTTRSWEDRHTPHDKDCPNFVDYERNSGADQPRQYCSCDFVTHERCCPQCNAKKVRGYWDLQAVKDWVTACKLINAEG